ncbi:MAG: hypothetical protein Kow0056_16840 [Coriobacteriia bacterium]
MSLRSALERLPHDSRSEALVREVLGLLRRNRDRWLSVEQVRSRVSRSEGLDLLLEVLTREHVLASDESLHDVMLADDAVVRIEVDRYLRRASHQDRRVQSNVERFRQRYRS